MARLSTICVIASIVARTIDSNTGNGHIKANNGNVPNPGFTVITQGEKVVSLPFGSCLSHGCKFCPKPYTLES